MDIVNILKIILGVLIGINFIIGLIQHNWTAAGGWAVAGILWLQ